MAQDIPRAQIPVNASFEQQLYLSVRLNETQLQGLFQFTLRDDLLYADRQTLLSIGFAAVELPATDGLIPLHNFVNAKYDAATQMVSLLAPLSSLKTSITKLSDDWQRYDPSAIVAPPIPGALLNYSLNANHSADVDTLMGYYTLRGFGVGSAIVETTGFVSFGSSFSEKRTTHRRLDTQVRWDLPSSAMQIQLGDVLTAGTLSWTRQTRLGGFRIGTNYGDLQPSRLLSPLPVFNGSATLPSSVDLFVNGMKQYSADVPVGPFSVQNAPGFTGAGNATLVVTDMFGQRRSIDIPFFYASQLLGAGITDWSVTGGVTRRNYAARNFDYASRPVLSASLRRGMNAFLTLEGNAEMSGTLRNGGLGAAFLLGRAGVLHVAASSSSLDGMRGHQWVADYQWNNRWLSAHWHREQASDTYRDIGSLEMDAPIARVNETAGLGVTTRRLGSFFANYTRLQYPGQNESQFAGLNWSKSSQRGWIINASYNRNFIDQRQSTAYIGLTVPLSQRGRYASASLQQTQNAQPTWVGSLQQSIQNEYGLGWRAQVSSSNQGYGVHAGLDYLGKAGLISVDAEDREGTRHLYAAAKGSVVWIGGGLQAVSSIYSSFALVQTGVAGVPILRENRPVGVTDARGNLLVTNLNALQPNRVAFDPYGLPANIAVSKSWLMVIPRLGAASRIKFDLHEQNPVLITLVDASGIALELGLAARVDSIADDLVVGYEGKVYVEDLAPGVHHGSVELPEGQCQFEFSISSAQRGIPTIGPIKCLSNR